VLEAPGREQRLGLLILAGAMAAAVAFLFWLQRDLAFADDSFNWLTLSGIGSTKALIEPYGGHLILTPLLIFKGGLAVFGASYTGFGVIQVIMLLFLSGLLYEYGRRRVGPLLALPAAAIVLFLGSSWNVLMQPMLGIQFFCALVPGIAALLALERGDRKGDVAGCAFLVLATLGFEIGLAFVAGAMVGIALRPDRRQRAWIVAIPILTYLVWRAWASQYPDTGLDLSNILWIPAYMVDSLGVIVVSLFGRFYWVGGGQLTSLKLYGFDLDHLATGLVLLALASIGVFLAVRALMRRGPIPPTFWVAVTIMVTLWIEQALALSSVRTPGEIRYILPDTVVFLLVAVEMARGIKATRIAVFIALLLTVAAVAGNLPRFKEGRDLLSGYSPTAKAAIAAVELGGSNVRPGFSSLDATEAYPPNRIPWFGASEVLAVSAKFGALGYSASELLVQDEGVRETADLVAARALNLGLTAAAPNASCRTADAAAENLELPPGEALLVANDRSPLLLRRFADRYVVDLGPLSPGRPVALRIPVDDAGVPWTATAAGGLAVCRP
jgi:hypothetical protein